MSFNREGKKKKRVVRKNTLKDLFLGVTLSLQPNPRLSHLIATPQFMCPEIHDFSTHVYSRKAAQGISTKFSLSPEPSSSDNQEALGAGPQRWLWKMEKNEKRSQSSISRKFSNPIPCSNPLRPQLSKKKKKIKPWIQYNMSSPITFSRRVPGEVVGHDFKEKHVPTLKTNFHFLPFSFPFWFLSTVWMAFPNYLRTQRLSSIWNSI